jgi:ParB-like chromosome segregation protein Spo0J
MSADFQHRQRQVDIDRLIDGEARYEAARQLGLDWIPCVRIEHLSKDEQRVLRLAVNRLAEKGQWDLDALKIEFEELIVIDAPIESRVSRLTRSRS